MTSINIKNIFTKFNSLKAIVIGDVMIDSYIWGKVERISPEAPVPVVAVDKRENRLGGAANVALNLQALGATPILCSVIGNDSKGDLFFDILKEQKLSSKGILKSKKRITTTKFRVIGNNTQMLRVDEENNSDISDEETKTFFNNIEKIIKQEKIDVIIFEDYDKGVITPALINKIAALASKNSIPVVADPKKKNFKEYKNITLFKPNLKELKDGMKIDFITNSQPELEQAAKTLQINNNIEFVMVTLSEAGIYFSQKEKNKIIRKQNIPAHVRNIADVSGAGDTVISVAALCLALKLDICWVAAISNLAGGLVCEEVGVVPINKEKLLKEALSLKQ